MFLTVFSHVVLSQMPVPGILTGDKAMWLLHMRSLVISLRKCTIDRQENYHIMLSLIFVKYCLKQNSRNSSSFFCSDQHSDRQVHTK